MENNRLDEERLDNVAGGIQNIGSENSKGGESGSEDSAGESGGHSSISIVDNSTNIYK